MRSFWKLLLIVFNPIQTFFVGAFFKKSVLRCFSARLSIVLSNVRIRRTGSRLLHCREAQQVVHSSIISIFVWQSLTYKLHFFTHLFLWIFFITEKISLLPERRRRTTWLVDKWCGTKDSRAVLNTQRHTPMIINSKKRKKARSKMLLLLLLLPVKVW